MRFPRTAAFETLPGPVLTPHPSSPCADRRISGKMRSFQQPPTTSARSKTNFMSTPFQKNLRNLAIGLLVGLALGLWFGVNLGRGHSLFCNPFAQQTIGGQLRETGTLVIDKSGQALEESGKAIRKAVR